MQIPHDGVVWIFIPLCLWFVSRQSEFAFFMRQLRLAHFFYKGEVTMPDYKTMYAKLFNAITDAVEILQQAQRDTEEMYIESGEKESLRTLDLQIIKNTEKKK